VKDSQADIGKARRLLGYEPIVPFEQGLEATVAWYRATLSAPTAV
jgi:nucleoside-diphosphate-sugar epimerase